MKRIFIISICLLVATGWSSAQTLTITQDFEKIQFASVMVLYKNLFGKHEKPDLDRNFPYALLRVGLEGDAQEVKAAKQQLNLYLGQTVHHISLVSKPFIHPTLISFLQALRVSPFGCPNPLLR